MGVFGVKKSLIFLLIYLPQQIKTEITMAIISKYSSKAEIPAELVPQGVERDGSLSNSIFLPRRLHIPRLTSPSFLRTLRVLAANLRVLLPFVVQSPDPRRMPLHQFLFIGRRLSISPRTLPDQEYCSNVNNTFFLLPTIME